MELKELIKNAEERIASYKEMLADVGRNKKDYIADESLIEWYKSVLRENKNNEEVRLKILVDDRTNEKEGLNPTFCYPKK